jgi:RNA polymerase-binding transcription factor DksA
MTKQAGTKKGVRKPVAKAGKAVKRGAKPPVAKPMTPRAKPPAAKPIAPGAGKPLPKKAALSRKPVLAVKSAAVAKPAPAAPSKAPVNEKSINALKDALLRMRERLTGQITALSDDSLKYVDESSSEDRTDDFDREFALNLMSTEHDSLYEIDEALRRISLGSYGLCDGCGCAIEKARLQALPFARMCIRCQSEMEKGRARFRPFGETITQVAEPTPEIAEPEEAE